jgi:penicillin-binding protein 1C
MDAPNPIAQSSPFVRRSSRWRRRLLRAFIAMTLFAAAALVGLAVAWVRSPFPLEKLDRWPRSPRVLDRHGEQMLQTVGMDDQWRIPVPLRDISPWLVKATIAVEDERFRSHPGVDPLAVLRAAGQNVAGGRIVSGASTLTMQVCRMMDDQPRTLAAKATEALRALQLEQLRSKDEILEIYLNIAPYGGNLRGVEAASLTYFNKRAKDLSLGEAALLAGLPQAPSRLRPDRHPQAAAARRETVLRRMVELNMITPRQAADAGAQAVAVVASSISRRQAAGRHAAWMALSQRGAGGMTTLDLSLQRRVESLVAEHVRPLPQGTDAAAVIIDIHTGDLLALVGSANPDQPRTGQVNFATARRSPGSALKPFIYAAAFETRRLNEASLVYDGPIERAGWAPQNFDRAFRGDVTVAEALRRSLNVPAILTAEAVGVGRCVGLMQAAGVALPADAARRGGLALAVGGVEVTLLDLTNAYATLGRGGVRQAVHIYMDETLARGVGPAVPAIEASQMPAWGPSEPVGCQPAKPRPAEPALSTETCCLLSDMLSTRHRRPRGLEHVSPSELPWFMWKTGTSSGRRDALAVGHNGKVAIGVWVGRASGAGDVSYVGVDAAEPLLAQLFDLPPLRQAVAPPPPESWAVVNPLPQPVERRQTLAILSPRDGSQFIAIDGRAIIHPRHNRGEGQPSPQWFLNGRLIDAAQAARLSLPAGSYELRCVGDGGEASQIRFSVR